MSIFSKNRSSALRVGREDDGRRLPPDVVTAGDDDDEGGLTRPLRT
jgi:hypothetical protein